MLVALAAIGVLLVTQQQSEQPGIELGEQPQVGGVYIEALIGSPSRLNPVLDYYNPVDFDVDRLVYSSLVKFDSRGLPYGDLAEDWGISQDVKVYNFALRQEATWHDGQPVTSEDVVFTIDLMRNEALPMPADLREFWDQIEVLAINDKTIQFRLPEAFSPFLDYLTFGILPRHLLQGTAPAELVNVPFNLNPVGSGPYRFEGLEVEGDTIQAVVLRANENYYGKKPFIEQIVFRYYPDSASAFAAYQQEEVMGISRVSFDLLPQALREPGLSVFTGRLPRMTLVYLNLDNPEHTYFQDANVRRALMLSINRRWIVDRVLNGQAILANGPIFPESWAYYEGVPQLDYDPIQAVQLLKQAEYTVPAQGGNVREKDGERLAFEMVYPEGEPYDQIAKRMQQDWAKVGVQVEIKPVPYETLLADYLEPRTYAAALVEINLARSPDPDPYPFWHQAQISGGQNYSQWDDRQVSEYLEQARVLVDLSERARRYRNFQVRFATELPALPLFYPVYTYAVDNRVRGANMGPLYDPSDRLNLVVNWFLRTGNVAAISTTPTP